MTAQEVFESDGKSTVWVAIDGIIVCVVSIMDSVRPEAATVVDILQNTLNKEVIRYPEIQLELRQQGVWLSTV